MKTITIFVYKAKTRGVSSTLLMIKIVVQEDETRSCIPHNTDDNDHNFFVYEDKAILMVISVINQN